ncbi:hypothetical protein CPB86DRAFT_810383 [Serendipita vermifera]|nr:hypothetical protein CPB86DRAFT_810383 [Serendipita vermifera]
MSGDFPNTPFTGDTNKDSKQLIVESQSPEDLIPAATPYKQSSTYFDETTGDHIQQQSTPSEQFNPGYPETPEKIKQSTRRRWDGISNFINVMGKNWTKAVHEKAIWPRVVYCLVGVAVVGIWLSITVNFAHDEQIYQNNNIFAEEDYIRMVAPIARPGISWTLQGRLQQFDPVTRVLNINWALKSIKNGQLEVLGENMTESTLIGIFRDQNLVPVNQSYQVIFPHTIDEIWDLRIANETAFPIAIVGRTQWDSFSTEIDMSQRKAGDPVRQPQFGFPFDLWSGSISFVANSWEFSKSLNSTTVGGIGIGNASLVDSLMNWHITVAVNNTCIGWQNGELTWLGLGPCGLYLTVNAKRTSLVKFASVLAVIINWLSTAFIFIMTCEGVFMQRFDIIMEVQLLAVCLTALFALPTVRSILPGAPDFGALNLVGIVPNIIIISICTTLVAMSTLKKLRSKTEQVQKKTKRQRRWYNRKRYNTDLDTKKEV